MDNTLLPTSALISVHDKTCLPKISKALSSQGVKITSTGGTEKELKKYVKQVYSVENETGYPSILGGRVKTLHPKIFGGILQNPLKNSDLEDLSEFDISTYDLVFVDLYPFESSLKHNLSLEEQIEYIDIGGISLIRAAAKNFKHVICIPSKYHLDFFLTEFNDNKGRISFQTRKWLASETFKLSSQYDFLIAEYLNESNHTKPLRYGENPHQNAVFNGNLNDIFDQLHGKELSYNNLLDIDAAMHLMQEFDNDKPSFAILKHNNACGLAQRDHLLDAYKAALEGDPVSAFGGILIANQRLDAETADQINKLFCEVVIAPDFDQEALSILKSKKKRILLKNKGFEKPIKQIRSCLNGTLEQDYDTTTDDQLMMQLSTNHKASEDQIQDLIFASKISKHTKSNTIVLAKNKQLLASGTGQTSRVDALEQAITKAQKNQLPLQNAVMASDAFFPFPDCVEIAYKQGISAVIQPGGSIKDQQSIDFCNEHDISMYLTGKRHFKH
jgi:phosphoribosylaminoimidazolecarboxamide formyltransferase/IMP cyclohydrolase